MSRLFLNFAPAQGRNTRPRPHTMEKPFVYGVAAEGDLFTDRETETERLLLNFRHGVNSILISPRRMGKTSLVKRVAQLAAQEGVCVAYLDIYKCRTEWDFYEALASTVIQATSTRVEQMLATARELLMSIEPRISYAAPGAGTYTFSVGLRRGATSPDDVLNLPERVAERHGKRLVVCIDEFQQIGEFADTEAVQRRIRSAWQHHHNASYCLFGSKKHVMATMFYTRNLPFYQFGDLFFLGRIPAEKWEPFLVARFAAAGRHATPEAAQRIAALADCYSAYVQQLAWNVLAESRSADITDSDIDRGLEATLAQVTPLFMEQTAPLTSFQLNLLRAICDGNHRDFGKNAVTSKWNLGTRSNLPKMIKALTDREIIDTDLNGTDIADPLYKIWFAREMM